MTVLSSAAAGPGERWLEAALRVLEREGPDALRVRRIADETGVSTIGLYTHFGSKEGLVGAVWSRGFALLGEELDRAGGTGVELVVDLGRRYAAWARAHPHLYGLMFQRSVPTFVLDDGHRAVAAATFERLVGACAGVTTDPVSSALTIWYWLHGALSLELAGVAPPGVDPVPDLDVVVRRLLAASPGREGGERLPSRSVDQRRSR